MTHRRLLALCLFTVVALAGPLACGTADGKGSGGAGGGGGVGGLGGAAGAAGTGGSGGIGGSGGRQFEGAVLTLAGISFND